MEGDEPDRKSGPLRDDEKGEALLLPLRQKPAHRLDDDDNKACCCCCWLLPLLLPALIMLASTVDEEAPLSSRDASDSRPSRCRLPSGDMGEGPTSRCSRQHPPTHTHSSSGRSVLCALLPAAMTA